MLKGCKKIFEANRFYNVFEEYIVHFFFCIFQLTIRASTTPIVGTTCVSCVANGHFFLTTSKSTSIEGTCFSGCTSATTYQWTVTDSSTSAVVSIDSSQTTTGLNQKNFVLKAGALPAGKTYTFKLEATEGLETGHALFSLPPSSKPSGGTCTVTLPATAIVPLQNYITVVCNNFLDVDTRSAIYYQIKIRSNDALGEKYLAYYGTRSENEIYVAPFSDAVQTIQVEVGVVNYYGAQVDATSL